MRKHMPQAHKIKATVHKSCALWRAVKLQTFFTAFGRIDYFVVVENPEASAISKDSSLLITQPEKELFEKLEKDYKDVKCDCYEVSSGFVKLDC
jgi:hypothetical protein